MVFFQFATFRQHENPAAVEAGVVVGDDGIVLLLGVSEDLDIAR